MATWRNLYLYWLREVKKSASDTLATDFVYFTTLCSMDIQDVAGVEKAWNVTIVANTESYTLTSASITDLHKARDGEFLVSGGTNELAEHTHWPVLDRYEDKSDTNGFYIRSSTIYVPKIPAEAGTLRIRGDKTLAAITTGDLDDGDTTTPEFDSDLHDIYVWHAAREFGAQKQDFDRSGRVAWFDARFQQRKRDIEARSNRRRYYNETQTTRLLW